MKKFFFIGAMTLSVISLAQKSNTSSAGLAFKDYQSASMSGDWEQAAKDLVEAKGYIDKSVVHVDTQNDPKTWMYYGFIYINIPQCAVASGDATLKAVPMDSALVWGFNGLKKSKELDKKETYVDQINDFCGMYRMMYSEMGIKAYDEGKYEEAMGGLLGAAIFGDAMGLQDSMFYFYGGLAAFNIEKYAEAEEAFKKTVEIGYKPGSSTYYLNQCYLKQGKKEESETMLKAQMVRYPKDKDIMIELINYYIDTDRKPEAIGVLNNAIALDPNNPVLIYTAGTIYENMGDFENAEKSYVKAMELGDKNAGFALGSLYFNKGADTYTKANELTFGSPEYNENYEKMIEESKVYFNKALPYLEKAAEENPNDLVILEALKAAYGKVGNTDKFLEVKKKIETIRAGQ